MSRMRTVLSIAGITMAVESEHEFQLTDRCCPFRVACERPDVTFRLIPAMQFDSEGTECIQQENHRRIYRRRQELFYVCADRQNPDIIRWYTRQADDAPRLVEVYVLAPDVWNFVNPLTFVELSDFMIRQNVMILHSSLISYEGKGIIFTAPSGTGKSTQAELWRKFRDAQILNGDRSMIRKTESGYRAYGSPYSGSSGIYRNESAPVTAIVVLRQAKENRIRRLGTREAYLCLLSEMSVSPVSRKTVELQSQWLLELIGQVPVWRLDCLPDEGAVDTLYEKWKEYDHET